MNVKFRNNANVKHRVLKPALDNKRIHLGMVQANIEHTEVRARRRAYDPVGLLFQEESPCPVPVRAAGEVPALAIRPERPKIQHTEALDIEAMERCASMRESTSPIDFVNGRRRY